MLKPGLLLVAVLSLCADAGALLAQEPPELDFIRGLRRRGWNDLALQRLQALQARTQPPLPAEWKLVIPLEIAKTQAALAEKMEDAADRDRLIDATRRDLDAFIKNPANAANPLLGEAHYDLARLTMERASTKAAESRHGEEAKQAADKQAAIALYATADASFKEAIKRLEERAKKVEDSKNVAERQAALEAHVEALFQHGLMTYQLSEVHGVDLKGGEALRASSKAFEALSVYRTKTDGGPGVVALGWQGYAWYGRTMIDIEVNKGTAAYAAIEKERRPEAVGAQRLVRYFKIVSGFRSGAPTAQRNQSIVEGEKWLKDYTAAFNSAEGQHIRYLLGVLYLDELGAEKDPQRKRTNAYETIVTKATNHLNELEKTSSRYGGVAGTMKLQVRFLSGQALTTPILQLRSFEDCMLRADHERNEAQQAAKRAEAPGMDEEKAKHQQQARTHVNGMIEASRRGIMLMPDNVKEDQWERAHQLLYIGYVFLEDTHRAAIVLDYLARNTKNPEKAQKHAANALKGYQFLSRNGDAYAKQQVLLIAAILEQRWPNSPETDSARDLLGFDHLRAKQVREGAAMLAKIGEKYEGFPRTSYWGGRAMWSLHVTAMRDAKKNVQSPSPERDQAIALLTRCIKAAEAPKPETNAKIGVEAKVGLAEIYNQLGQPEEVLKLVTPLIAAVAQNKLPQDVEATAGTQILGLALRANIQKKDIDGAVKALEVLQKQGNQEDIGKGLQSHLVSLGQQIKSEIENLSAQGDTERLQQTKDSFRNFLTHLEKDSKLPIELVLWVGSNYSLLDEHAKAAEVFARVNAETPPGNEKNNMSAQLLYHAALRQAAADADKSKQEELFKKADAELADAMKKSDKIKRHPAFVKEQIHLKQERGQLSGANGAISGWDKLRIALEPNIERSAQFKQRIALEPNIERSAQFKQIYLDASYYLVWCLYQEAKLIRDPSVKKEALDRAAQKLRSFQQIEDLKPRLDELLNKSTSKDLKEAYTRLGRAAVK